MPVFPRTAMATATGEDPALSSHFKGHRNNVTSLHFNPTDTQLVSSSLDNNLMIWNFRQQHQRAYRFVGHTDAVNDVRYSPSGNLMASASRDCTVRLWIPNVRGDSTAFRAHQANVRTVDFSPDGQQLASGSDDKSIKIWTVHRHKFVCSLATHTNWVRCVRFSPDGRMLVSCADDKTVQLHDALNATPLHTFTELKGSCTYAAFHPSGYCIATAGKDGNVKVYDIRTRKLLQFYEFQDQPVTAVSFHPSGHILLTCSADILRLLDLLEGRPIYTLHGHRGSVTCCTFSSTGEYFASGSQDKQVLVWRSNLKSVERCEALEEVEEERRSCSPLNVTAQVPLDGVEEEEEDEEEEEEVVQDHGEDENQHRKPRVDADAHQNNIMRNGIKDKRAEDDLRNGMKSFEATLQRLSSQMDTLTQTIVILEQRLSLVENKVAEVAYNQQQTSATS